jgi:heat-inducible transcriptional repressor
LELDQRKQKILRAVVNTYIVTGEPVGSKALLAREQLNVSSATVRNEMNDLEKLGYLAKTHTSSGRVPSNEGFRYYVTTSLPSYDLTGEELNILSPDFGSCANLDDAMQRTVSAIAEFSGCAVFGLSAMCDDGCFLFDVAAARSRSLVIMAEATTGAVKSRFVRIKRPLSADTLNVFTRILNKTLSGFSVSQVGAVRLMLLEKELRAFCPQCLFLLPEVKSFIEELKRLDLHVSGAANLLSYPEFANVETARAFIKLLDSPERIVEALSGDIFTNGISIKIGAENKIFDSPKASMISISSTYRIPTVFGIMGPTRMDYSRLIAGCSHILSSLWRTIDNL